MAGPAVAGTVMAGTLVGGIIQGIGADQSAQAQAAASTYRAGVAQLNRQINQQNAAWAIEAGGTQAEVSGLKSRSEIAQTKVAQAASGFDVNTGTSEKVREDQSSIAAFDQNVIRWDAAKTAYGYETKATMDVAESQLDLASAAQEREAGQLAMLGSFINAGTSVSSKWMQAKQLGMFA